MCCRYYYDLNGIQKDIDGLDVRYEQWPKEPEGEIGPGRDSLMIAGKGGLLILSLSNWGFPGKDKGLMINARSESVLSRPTFSSSALSRRCALPAVSFFEWDRRKQLVQFGHPSGDVMFLAGIWNMFGDELRFTVLTTEANESVSPVHERMPLILDRKDVGRWILDARAMESIMGRQMPQLEPHRREEQLSLF